MKLYQKISVVVATGFGLGYSPVASGTVGTLPGVLLVWLLFPGLSWGQQAIWAAVLALLAIPFCEVAERTFNKKDDGRIVADEYLTFPIAVIGLPLVSHPWVLLMAFLTSRFFDILKPPPARGLQRIHGGFGIVIDDVIASLYSLLANHLLYFALTRWILE